MVNFLFVECFREFLFSKPPYFQLEGYRWGHCEILISSRFLSGAITVVSGDFWDLVSGWLINKDPSIPTTPTKIATTPASNPSLWEDFAMVSDGTSACLTSFLLIALYSSKVGNR